MTDMNSITNEIKCLDAYVKTMKNSYTHSTLLEDLDNVLMHINNLKVWAGIDVEAGTNTLPIQRVSNPVCPECGCVMNLGIAKRLWICENDICEHTIRANRC